MGEDESEQRFGSTCYSPQYAQKLANINCFLFLLSLLSVTQGMLVNGLVNASIPHLEREFGLTSTQTGFISASNDISGLLFVLLISYYGGKGHKPKWIGWGAIIIGMGALLFTLPKLLKGTYGGGSVFSHYKDFETCQSNQTINGEIYSCQNQGSSAGYLAIFCVAEFIMGLGATPLFTLGATYLDENVSPKNSPIYIGIWYGTTFFGPSLGYVVAGFVLNEYVDPGHIPVGLHSDSSLWVGRWWLPFIILCWIQMIIGFLLLLFPKTMPGTKALRMKAIEAGDIEEEKDNNEADVGFKGLLKSTLQMVKNKTLLLACLALASKTIAGSGVAPFFTKLTMIKYGAKQSEANFFVGLLVVCGTSVGLAIGSVVMRKVRVKGSVRTAAVICAGLSLLGVASGFVFSVPGCETAKVAGVNINFDGRISSEANLKHQCNQQCQCLQEYYLPLCFNGLTYFSPCFAGCRNKTKSNIYANCSCAMVNQNMTSSLYLWSGKCNQNCKNLTLYIALIFFVLVVAFAKGTPSNMIVLRSVPEKQRSVAMGFQFLLLRSLAFLPGPVLAGKIIDSSCMIWKYDDCGKKSNCDEYDLDKLSSYLTTAFSACSGIATILYSCAWISYPAKKENHAYRLKDGKIINAYENQGYDKDDTKL